MLIIIINIWGAALYSNLKNYGVFIPVIILEFTIFVITWSFFGFVIILLFIVTIDNKPRPRNIIATAECPVIIINIPQLAMPANVELTSLDIPQAKPFTPMKI